MSGYAEKYLNEVKEIAGRMDVRAVEALALLIVSVREQGGRIFFLGVGGSAANASHAVNDFRKIGGIECYTPTDNVSELTARINDQGWDDCFSEWLKGSRISAKDLVFVFSVGGGNLEKKVSINIVRALEVAKQAGSKIGGVVGRDGGYTAKVADACVIIPTVNSDGITPHTEAFQAVVWHLLISHPLLLKNEMKWESIK